MTTASWNQANAQYFTGDWLVSSTNLLHVVYQDNNNKSKARCLGEINSCNYTTKYIFDGSAPEPAFLFKVRELGKTDTTYFVLAEDNYKIKDKEFGRYTPPDKNHVAEAYKTNKTKGQWMKVLLRLQGMPQDGGQPHGAEETSVADTSFSSAAGSSPSHVQARPTAPPPPPPPLVALEAKAGSAAVKPLQPVLMDLTGTFWFYSLLFVVCLWLVCGRASYWYFQNLPANCKSNFSLRLQHKTKRSKSCRTR